MKTIFFNICVFCLAYLLPMPHIFSQTISDVEGNIYKTIQIGDQLWMAENLRTTRLNNGIRIPQLQIDAVWESTEYPGYCWFNNDTTNKSIYGALYNYYAINTDKLCPIGWHIPSEAEWTELIDYIGRDGKEGIKLKEQGSKHWEIPEWTSSADSATNITGFTALPAGTRDFHSSEAESMRFDGLGRLTQYGSSDGSGIYLDVNSGISRSNTSKNAGISIRCIKDKK